MRFLGEPRIALERARVAARIELERLLDVSLQQRHAQGFAARRAPFHMAQRLADADDRHQRAEPGHRPRTARRQQPDHARSREREKGKREHAAERRIALQRPADGGIADGEPGEAGQDPGAQPLEEDPRRRYQQTRA